MANLVRLLVVLLVALLLSCAGSQQSKNPELAAHQEAPALDATPGQVVAMQELSEWRGRIDSADRELVALLNRRAEYVLRLAPLKRQIGAAVLDPGRELEVLRNLREANSGPLTDEALENIYASIMAAMRDLQSPE